MQKKLIHNKKTPTNALLWGENGHPPGTYNEVALHTGKNADVPLFIPHHTQFCPQLLSLALYYFLRSTANKYISLKGNNSKKKKII